MTDGVGNVADPAAVELPAGRAYLSLGEVLDVLKEQFADVTISKIRFFEAQGLLVPERTPSGYRKFFPADIERLRVILADQEQRYVPLAAARAVVSQATAEPVSPVGPVPATGTGSSASAAADTTLSRDTPAAMGASAAFGEHPAGSGDAGEVELEENYDGVDLGSDRHPALRGRREAGPPTPSRRPRPEPNRPPAGQPASATNVAPLRRVAATASAGVQSAAPSSGTASGDVGPDLAHGEWVAEAASYSRAEVLAATGASEALFDDAVKQGFLRGRSVLT